jgi:predicted Zn-dependent protease
VDDAGLEAVAARAAEAAASAPEDPGFPGLASAAPVQAVDGYDEATANLSPADQARRATEAIEASAVPAYGFFTSGATDLAIASTTGLAVQQRMTDAMTLVVAADERRSGYAEGAATRADAVNPAAVAREASAKAERTADAVAVEPGPYAAVLEPYAFADLLHYFSFDSFGALGMLEQRGYLAGRVGEQIVDKRITIADDPFDPQNLPKSFDFEGTPKQRVELVTDGVARGVVWDRATARRAGDGHATTGHAPSLDDIGSGPLPYAMSVAPGDAESVEELAERIGDGLYITRLHYLGVVHPREGVITGMTRDGTFRIRDGKIAEPVVNLRFTVSVPEMLRDVHGLTRDVTLVNASNFYGERYPFGTLVPALATARFNVTGVGSAPGI